MRLGFTGTRQGMTAEQRAACAALLREFGVTAVHHGDATGADAEFHDLARAVGVHVTVHPPLAPQYRAWKTGDIVHQPARYKIRNRAIVDASEVVLGAPADTERASPHSGTWFTLRYAVRRGKWVVVIWADGERETLADTGNV